MGEMRILAPNSETIHFREKCFDKHYSPYFFHKKYDRILFKKFNRFQFVSSRGIVNGVLIIQIRSSLQS